MQGEKYEFWIAVVQGRPGLEIVKIDHTEHSVYMCGLAAPLHPGDFRLLQRVYMMRDADHQTKKMA